jgi:membrane dipeptidase
LGFGRVVAKHQPDSIVEWMRVGRWSKEIDYGEGSAAAPGFPPMPVWFKDNRDFANIEQGLKGVGMNEDEVAGIMGRNWYRFYAESFGPA